MIRTKRIVGIILSLTLVLGASNVMVAAADSSSQGNMTPSKVEAFLKPDITVKINGKVKKFKDVQGQEVYPLIYNGSAYLPVRAISALMKENIEWANETKTVFIGKTLSNPNKSASKNNIDSSAVTNAEELNEVTAKEQLVSAYVKPDVTIMFDFNPQNFVDFAGRPVYPMIYKGSTYLPIRAVSVLMEERVTWDNVTKTIAIGEEIVEKEPAPVRESVSKLLTELETCVEIYDEANDAVAKLRTTTRDEQLLEIATSVSTSLQKAKDQSAKLKALSVSHYDTDEIAAYKALCGFSEASEYYILILENISYMAASKVDYSMLSETFINYAVDSQSRMDLARDAIENLYEDIY